MYGRKHAEVNKCPICNYTTSINTVDNTELFTTAVNNPCSKDPRNMFSKYKCPYK